MKLFNKKAFLGRITIYGVSLIVIIRLFIMIFVVGPAVDQAIGDVIAELGTNNVCPEEFSTEAYKICFDADGQVIVSGKVDETLQVRIDGLNDVCHVVAGSYDFEYTGCKLDNFKRMTAYELVVISKTGRISLKGSTLAKQIISGTGIIKMMPKGILSLKKALYFVRFI